MSKRQKGHIGSSFEDFLKEEGAHEQTNAAALKRVLAWELQQAMTREGVTKNELARRMRTSRSQLDRILDPKNAKVQLDTVFKAARALGRQVRLELV